MHGGASLPAKTPPIDPAAFAADIKGCGEAGGNEMGPSIFVDGVD